MATTTISKNQSEGLRTGRLLPGIGFALFLGFCIGLAGCAGAPSEAPGKPTPTVTVSYPLEREVTDYQDYTGRTAAVDSVQIQARVSGYLVKALFKEGAEVKKDDILFEIDPRLFQAQLDKDLAQLKMAEAKLKQGEADFTRAQDLVKKQTVAVAEYDAAVANLAAALASVAAAKASIEESKLNLEFCTIRSPKDGLVSKYNKTVGNLVSKDQTLLTTVVSTDPMYVYFDVDEPTALVMGELARQGKFGPAKEGRPPNIPFRLQLANEKGFPHEATLDFVNNQLDQATATLSVRAGFSNPRPEFGPRVFAPNNFVRVRVPTSAPYQALLVNAEAVGTDQNLKYLYVVDDHNEVVRHAVKLGTLQDGLQVVAEGLKPGERVVIRGLQRIQPGVIVNPRLAPMPIPAQGALPPLVPKTLVSPPKK